MHQALAAAATLAIVAASGASRAATITNTYDFAVSYYTAPNLPDPYGQIGLGSFDASLGILTGVSYEMSGLFTNTYTSSTGTGTVFPATFSSGVSVTADGGTRDVASSQQSGSASTAMASTSFDADLSGTVGTDALELYEYPGNYILYTSGSTVVDNDTGTDLYYPDGRMDFDGTVTETFTYSPFTSVPEPGSLSVLAVAVLGLFAAAALRKPGTRA